MLHSPAGAASSNRATYCASGAYTVRTVQMSRGARMLRLIGYHLSSDPCSSLRHLFSTLSKSGVSPGQPLRSMRPSSTTPELKPGACIYPSQGDAKGWLTTAHCARLMLMAAF